MTNNLSQFNNSSLTGLAQKNLQLKKAIAVRFLQGNTTIADLCDELSLSAPKVNGLLNELIEAGYVKEYGKIDTKGGRRPNQFGLNLESGFILGVDIRYKNINIGLADFHNNIIHSEENIPFDLKNTEESFNSLISIINKCIDSLPVTREKIFAAGISLRGKINMITGYSHDFLNFTDQSLRRKIGTGINLRVYIENDIRAMALGEFSAGIVNTEKNVLFLTIDFGVGVSILTDSKVYYGKSGFAGEFGHIPFFNNDIMCHCGKIGCLETEVSGWSLILAFRRKLQEGYSSVLSDKNINEIDLDDIINAVNQGDTLAIELLSEMAEKLGKGIALLINIFNPELVILGGALSRTGEYLRLPVKSSLIKYSLNLISNDAKLRVSKLGEKSALIGACLFARNSLLDIA